MGWGSPAAFVNSLMDFDYGVLPCLFRPEVISFVGDGSDLFMLKVGPLELHVKFFEREWGTASCKCFSPSKFTSVGPSWRRCCLVPRFCNMRVTRNLLAAVRPGFCSFLMSWIFVTMFEHWNVSVWKGER
jgi:hypothetical protein